MQILLIDNDHEEHELFGWVLKRIDSTIKFYASTNCQDAIDDFKNEIYLKPDLIFIDGNMPEIDGKRCILLMRENTNLEHVPMIIYSGSLHPSEEREYITLGIYKYLVKPKDLVILEQELRAIIRSFNFALG